MGALGTLTTSNREGLQEAMRHGPQTLTSRFLFLLSLTAQLLFLALGTCFAISREPLLSFHATPSYALQGAFKTLHINRLDESHMHLTPAEREHQTDEPIPNFRVM